MFVVRIGLERSFNLQSKSTWHFLHRRNRHARVVHDFCSARRSLPRVAHRCNVTDKDARRNAMSDWFMEFSVLWAVFPLLDWLVENQSIELRILAVSFGISLTATVIGLILRRGERA
jgi:hypothetical protein